MSTRDLLSPHRVEQVFEVLRRILTKPQRATAAITLDAANTVVLCDATAAAFTVTLPPAAKNPARVYTVKKIDASVNAVTVDGNAAETIDGAATHALALRWNSVTIYSDGSNWIVLSAV